MTVPIKLVSTDFDGTLHADHETPPVPEDLQMYLGELQSQGVSWVINTGRDLSSVMEGIGRARLSVRPDYLVVVERHIYERQGSHFVPWTDWNGRCDQAHRDLFERVRPDVKRLVEWIDERFQATLYEDDYSPFCLIAEDHASAEAIHAHLESFAEGVSDLAVVRNDVYARFSHVGFNKGTALAEIARRLGVPSDQVLAAGDHLNDLPMLSSAIAGCLVAPDNAIASVKDAVRKQRGYISHQPWGHGVARGLEHFAGLTPR